MGVEDGSWSVGVCLFLQLLYSTRFSNPLQHAIPHSPTSSHTKPISYTIPHTHSALPHPLVPFPHVRQPRMRPIGITLPLRPRRLKTCVLLTSCEKLADSSATVVAYTRTSLL